MTNPYQKPNSNNGFTLIELLLVISILAVLASLSLVVVAGAQNDARRSATQSRISLIQSMLQQRFDDYQVRRVPLEDPFNYMRLDNGQRFQRPEARDLRNRIVLEYIKTEMPRSIRDLAIDNTNTLLFPGTGFRVEKSLPDYFRENIQNADTTILSDLDGRFPSFATRFFRFDPSNPNDGVYPEGRLSDFLAGNLPIDATTVITTSSEYLYLVLQMTDYQGTPATEFLGSQAIGDTDNDGFLEILDAFGFPISFSIEMHDDNGTLILDPISRSMPDGPVFFPNPPLVPVGPVFVPWQIDPTFNNTFDDQPLLDPITGELYAIRDRTIGVNNLRFRLISALGGEIISN